MNAEVPQHRFRAGDADRDRALEVIRRAYEAGRLSLDELNERQERALRCVFTDEFPALVADLPERDELERHQFDRQQFDREGTALAPTSRAPLPEVGPPDAGFALAVLSGRERVLPSGTRHASGFAWWGGDDYYLREAMGPGRTVTLELSAVMAGHDIFVPEGVRIIDQSTAIMAGNDIHRDAQGDGSNGTLVLTGFLFWAGHDVKLEDPDRR